MHSFGLKLALVLEELAIDKPGAENAPNQAEQNGPVKDQAQNANKLGDAKNTDQNKADKQKQQENDNEQQKRDQQSSQLKLQLTNFDKQIAQLQAKITGAAAKPADINKLNTILTARKNVEDQFMRLYGVAAT